MIQLDGSQGEGGGQILRTALTLSVITGKPFIIEKIRARRARPGLMAQHLKAVQAAAQISGAWVQGAVLNSANVRFEPHGFFSGNYHFDIGTAGATTLILQTIFFPLSFTNSCSNIRITGGTHVPWSPPFHMVERHWLGILKNMGYNAELNLVRAGFYPNGTGELHATIFPADTIVPLELIKRGKLITINGISAVANLDFQIAQRQKQQAKLRLQEKGLDAEIKIENLPSRFKGTMLMLQAQFEHTQCCYSSLGAIRKSAEQVADEAVTGLFEYLDSDAAVDQYLADQLVLPLLLAGGKSEITISRITNHLLTNIEIVKKFVDTRIFLEGDVGSGGKMIIDGINAR